jgi:hypothetical protein
VTHLCRASHKPREILGERVSLSVRVTHGIRATAKRCVVPCTLTLAVAADIRRGSSGILSWSDILMSAIGDL